MSGSCDIRQEIGRRILILDGAMGTMLQRVGARSSTGVADLLNLENPEAVLCVHRAYIEAGADIITANTFNNAGREANLAGIRLARKAAVEAGRKVCVAGSVGPTSKMLSLSADATHPEARPATFFEQAADYESQIEALTEAGADLLLIETVFDPINAKAALYAASKVAEKSGIRLPIMLSATINDRNGRLLTGQSVEALYHTVEGYGLFSFGLNCSFGAEGLAGAATAISKFAGCFTSIHPNAGLPNEAGEYDETPEHMASTLSAMAREGLLNIAGGCCGTTPAHIKALREALEGIPPRKVPAGESDALVVTGLDCIPIDLKESNFVNVGERTNVAGSRKFAKLIAAKDYESAAAIARRQIEDGASVIDINMDDAMLDSRAEMERFVRIISNDPDIARAAFMIDSSDWETLLAGITNTQGRCIVNSISLKEGEAEFLRKALEIKRLGAAVIVMAFDEEGQATTYGRKIAICERSYRLLTSKAGFRPQDIIFDVNILTIGTGFPEHARYAVDFIEAVRWIKANLPGCHTSGGVSNLSFAFRGNNPVREAMHSVFLYHAIEAGLDMAIVNAGALLPYDSLDPELRKAAEDVVLDRDPEAVERLSAIATRIKESEEAGTPAASSRKEEWRSLPLEERLSYALQRGIPDYLEEDLSEARASLSPVAIIEGPLLRGMENVGTMFSEGKMFLPQVIKSAKVMRDAVALLEPYMEKGGESEGRRRRMVLATASGDVHDIGKNILSVVLACNGIEVIDLGVMVDNPAIIEAIKEHKPDFVGISGLITPSLKHMEELCRMMEAEGFEIPLFVGGATTSALHTAVKLAPLYSHAVIYTSGASDCATMVNRYLMDPAGCTASVREAQERLRNLHASRNESFVTPEEALAAAPKFPIHSFVQPEGFGQKEIFEQFMPVERLVRRIDWSMFLSFWGFRGDFRKLVEENPEAARSYEDGMAELSRMIINRSVEVTVRARFYDACAEGNAILLPETGSRFEMGRSTSSLTGYVSLADFFPPAESGLTSRAGLFVVKVRDLSPHCGEGCKEYPHLLREALCARLAEAAAEWLSEEASCGSHLIRPAFGYPSCPDHSLKAEAFRLLEAQKLGMALTSSFSMIPATSVCGMLISHPEARYINIRNDEGH
ncbi:MAG: methionine synthase [Bacteroidales bacterium]|nr:methionine synthase [Bacteroidales bacterium]